MENRDGKYCWRYDVHLIKNPHIFFLIWRIFFFVLLGIFSVTTIVDIIDWPENAGESALGNLKMFGFFLIGMTVLTLIGYFIYAAIMGFRYSVEFEMDEKGVLHSQVAEQAKKAKKIAKITSAAGASTGSLSTVAVGMNASRTEMYSEFSKVKKVKAYPRKNLIKVNGLLNHNQVYVSNEDFDFVKEYIISHCPNLK